MASTASPAPVGRPARTSRHALLEAAQRLIEEQGWERLTIRRLATELGVSTGTVYNHVRNKDDLLLALLDAYAEERPRPELPEDPTDRIAFAATAIRDALAARPWTIDVLAHDRMAPPAALWYVEVILQGAIDLGLNHDDAVTLYRNIWYLTVGDLVVRQRRAASDTTPGQRDDTISTVDPTRYPRLSTVGDRWPELTTRDTYAHGVRALIAGSLPAPSED